MRKEDVALRFWRKVLVTDECWTWLARVNDRGYGQIRNGASMWLAHRVSWVLHFGPIPGDLHVLHHCDNPPCVRPDHLWTGTDADNCADKVRKGRQHTGPYPMRDVCKGERHYLAKLAANDVCDIRAKVAAGSTQTALATEHGVSVSTIAQLVHRRSWKHVA